MSADLSNMSVQEGYIRLFRRYPMKRNWLGTLETREILSQRLRNRGFEVDESMNDEVEGAESLLFPEGEMRTYYVANVTMDEKSECNTLKGNQFTCRNSLETCPLRNLHCRYVTLRPVMTPSLAEQLPKGWTLMARCWVDCPLSSSRGALEIESIFLYPDVPQKETEVTLTTTPRFHYYPQSNGENMLTVEFLQSLPKPEQSSVKGLQEWQKEAQWRQNFLAVTTLGMRALGWKWDQKKREITIAIIGENKESVKLSGFFQKDAEYNFVPLDASTHPWEWCPNLPDKNASRARRRNELRLGKLVEKKDRKNPSLTCNEQEIAGCPWKQPQVMTLTFPMDKHPITIFSPDGNLLDDNAVNTENEWTDSDDWGKLNGFLIHSMYMEEALLKRLEENITTVMKYGTPDSPELLEYLFNVKKARLPEENTEKITFFNQDLNPAQQEAVQKMCAVPQIGFLQGPPGTGKTEVIAEIIMQHVTRGKRVLVSSQSIVAVDNALERLRLQHRQDIFPLRLKRTKGNHDEESSYTLENFAETYCKTIRTPATEMLESWKAKEARLEMLRKKLEEHRKLQKEGTRLEVTIQECQNRKQELVQSEKQAQNDVRTQTNEATQKSYENDPEMLKLYQKRQEVLDQLGKDISDEEYDRLEEQTNQLNRRLRERRKALQEEECAQGASELERIRDQIQRIEKRIRETREQRLEWQENVQNFLKEMVATCFPQEKISASQVIQHMRDTVNKMKEELESGQEVRNHLEPILREWCNMSPTQHDKEILEDIYPQLSNVVGVTCTENPRTLADNNVDSYFDLVIIDEVSRVTPPELLHPLRLAPKTILVGDHRQLPPIFREKEPDNWDELLQKYEQHSEELDRLPDYRRLVENSLFRKYFEQADERLKASLTTQYRMHPQIMNMINVFYNNKLSCGLQNPDAERNHGMTLPYLKQNAHVLWVDSSRTPQDKKFYDERVGSSYVNKLEVELIMQMLEDIDAKLTTSKTVGIIAFYGKQTRELLHAVEKMKFEHLKCRISTVDRFQGQECDIILVSMTRNPRHGHIREKSFATSYERINVAFSRARELLVVVGARKAFENIEVEIPDADGNKTRRKVYEAILRDLKFKSLFRSSRNILHSQTLGQKPKK